MPTSSTTTDRNSTANTSRASPTDASTVSASSSIRRRRWAAMCHSVDSPGTTTGLIMLPSLDRRGIPAICSHEPVHEEKVQCRHGARDEHDRALLAAPEGRCDYADHCAEEHHEQHQVHEVPPVTAHTAGAASRACPIAPRSA